MIDKGNARVLAIHPMTGDAVVRERLLAIGPGIGVRRQGILLVLVAYEDVMFGEGHGLRLDLTGRAGLTTGQSQRSDCRREYKNAMHR